MIQVLGNCCSIADGSNLIASEWFNFNLSPLEGTAMRHDTDDERRPMERYPFLILSDRIASAYFTCREKTPPTKNAYRYPTRLRKHAANANLPFIGL
jgi:hypothetical protein